MEVWKPETSRKSSGSNETHRPCALHWMIWMLDVWVLRSVFEDIYIPIHVHPYKHPLHLPHPDPQKACLQTLCLRLFASDH